MSTFTWPPLFELFPQIWKQFIESDLTDRHEKSFVNLQNFVYQKYGEKPNRVFPPKNNIFNCFSLHPVDVKTILLGQDPYHGIGQANGYSFSVSREVKIPPSLQNIFKELKSDLGIKSPNHGDLTSWVKNGVLLLNSVLTVDAGKPGTHKSKGWEVFTSLIINSLSLQRKNLVFFLWGNQAKLSKSSIRNQNNHLIIESVHPSPYSANNGFFGSRPFSKCNNYLIENGLPPIDWSVS